MLCVLAASTANPAAQRDALLPDGEPNQLPHTCGGKGCFDWKHWGAMNCYDGHGAPGAPGAPNATGITLRDCKQSCLDAGACQAVVVNFPDPDEDSVTCWLREAVNPDHCNQADGGFHLFTLKNELPPLQSAPRRVRPGDDPAQRRVVLYGALGRHNFGDLLMGEIHAALIKLARPELPVMFADLFPGDMTPYGGQKVQSVTSLFDSPDTVTDVIHVGGDTLGVTLNAALEAFPDHAEEMAAVRQRWRAHGLSNSTRSAYLLPKQLFRHPGAFIVNGVGGGVWKADLTAISDADYVGTRNPLRGVHHIPDPVILLYSVLGSYVLAARSSNAMNWVRQATEGRSYWTVQLSDDFGKAGGGSSIGLLADNLCAATKRIKDKAIVLFRAGAIHDSLQTLGKVKDAMQRKCAPEVPVVIFEELDIFCICALIAESALLLSTSLHARIVALNYQVPRVTFSARPEVSKHSFFAYHWDDLHATEKELQKRRDKVANCTLPLMSYEPDELQNLRQAGQACDAGFARFCGWNNATHKWNACGGVVPVGAVADAIEAAHAAKLRSNWTTAQSDRQASLVPKQQAAVGQWMPLL